MADKGGMKVSKVIGVEPLPAEFYLIIGEILIEWGWLEHRLREVAGYLLKVDMKTARSITGQVDTRGLVRGIKQIALRKLAEPCRGQLIAILDNIERSIDRRNRMVHGTWSADKDRMTFGVRQFREGHSPETKHYKLQDLKAFLSRVKQDRAGLLELLG